MKPDEMAWFLQTKKEVKLNDRQKKLYADMESKLDELDAAAE